MENVQRQNIQMTAAKKEATKFLIEYGFTDSLLCQIWEHQGKINEQPWHLHDSAFYIDLSINPLKEMFIR